MMTDEDDWEEFKKNTATIVPFKQPNKASVLNRKQRASPPISLSHDAPEPYQLQTSLEILQHYEAEKQLIRNGISLKQFKKLKSGKISIEYSIDLHGFTLSEAEAVTLSFIEKSRELGYSCIKIIHGKGLHTPPGRITLRTLVRYLLTQLTVVLAYSAAPLVQGGDGAVLILLKKQNLKDEDDNEY